jgi:hypothetical protein
MMPVRGAVSASTAGSGSTKVYVMASAAIAGLVGGTARILVSHRAAVRFIIAAGREERRTCVIHRLKNLMAMYPACERHRSSATAPHEGR